MAVEAAAVADRLPVSLEVQAIADKGQALVTRTPIALGQVILSESPALAVDQVTAEPTLPELQAWADAFAALGSDAREAVLGLWCPPMAADGCALARLLGRSGERAGQLMRCPAGVTEEELWKLLRIVECNSFQVPTPSGAIRVELLCKIARLNHSCLPNALRGPGSLPGTVEVRALRPIAEGEELTISYVDEELLLSPTAERRAAMSGQWQFRCGCARCAAPDALRAFRCGPACGGQLLFASSARLCACGRCGRAAGEGEAAAAEAAEEALALAAEPAAEAARAAGAALGAALRARDGEALGRAVEQAFQALTACRDAVAASPAVAPAHHAALSLTRTVSSTRTMLGDAMAAAGRGEMAVELWARSAQELSAALEAERAALPLPRDGRAAGLLELAGLHSRLRQPAAARPCLAEALENMRAVYWSCAPSERERAVETQREVERALAELQ